MTYTPNWRDPRIQRRTHTALAYCERYLRKGNTQWLSRRELYKHFGNTSRDLGKYLKSTLLNTEDNYYNALTGQCKKYSLNTANYKELCRLTDYTQDIEPDTQLTQELELGTFEYTHSSNRQFHPLQFQPKHKKRRLLGRMGYRYEFDIQAAAHTLLVQHARQLGHTKPTPTLDEYIQNRTQLRDSLAKAFGITTKQTKTILTGILQGGILSTWHTNRIYQELDYNSHTLDLVRNNAFIQQYQQEVREIWKTIKIKRGITERMTGKKKAEIYRELESLVGKCIQRYLKKSKNTYFFEHDGWSCREMIDPNQLRDQVRQQTGFVIELDTTIYEEHI